MRATMNRVHQLTDKSQMLGQMPDLIANALTAPPKPGVFSIGRSRQASVSDQLNHKRPVAVRIRVPAELADIIDKKITQALHPPTVANINTAEEYDRLPAGTVITSGKYKGIKLAEVTVKKSSGTAPFRNYSDYREYVLMKYPGTAHLFLTSAGKYGPWVGPQENWDLIGVQATYSGSFLGLSAYGAIGWAQTHRQSQMYLSFGHSGKFGDVFGDTDDYTKPLKLFGGGVGFNVFKGDYTARRPVAVDIDAFKGWTRALNVYTPGISFGLGSSANYNPNNLDIAPSDGFKTIGLGLGEGWGAAYDYSYTYFDIPGTDIRLPNTNNSK